MLLASWVLRFRTHRGILGKRWLRFRAGAVGCGKLCLAFHAARLDRGSLSSPSSSSSSDKLSSSVGAGQLEERQLHALLGDVLASLRDVMREGVHPKSLPSLTAPGSTLSSGFKFGSVCRTSEQAACRLPGGSASRRRPAPLVLTLLLGFLRLFVRLSLSLLRLPLLAAGSLLFLPALLRELCGFPVPWHHFHNNLDRLLHPCKRAPKARAGWRLDCVSKFLRADPAPSERLRMAAGCLHTRSCRPPFSADAARTYMQQEGRPASRCAVL